MFSSHTNVRLGDWDGRGSHQSHDYRRQSCNAEALNISTKTRQRSFKKSNWDELSRKYYFVPCFRVISKTFLNCIFKTLSVTKLFEIS
jgi:hypothetical protein